MMYHVIHLSCTWESFKSECDHLKMTFTNLKYPESLINSSISHFVIQVRSDGKPYLSATLVMH